MNIVVKSVLVGSVLLFGLLPVATVVADAFLWFLNCSFRLVDWTFGRQMFAVYWTLVLAWPCFAIACVIGDEPRT